jgi:hypothetical protein
VANPYLTDVLRRGRGVLDATASLGSSMLADIPAGSAGLYALATGRGLDQAAEDVERTRERFTYQPRSQEGQEALVGVGEGMNRAIQQALRVPGVKPTTEAGQRAWEGFTNYSPAAGALLAGVAGAGVPETRPVGEAARIAALADVRRTVPKGPALVSAVDEAIGSLPARGTVKQYYGTLKNRPGIKGEELADLDMANWPDVPVTREQFAELVRGARPWRDVTRQSFADLDPKIVDERVAEVAETRLQGAAGNADVFERQGLGQFIPLGEHPETTIRVNNKARTEAWIKKLNDDPETFESLLEYAIEEMESMGGKQKRMAQRHMDDPDDDEAFDYVKAMMDNLAHRALVDPQVHRGVFNPEMNVGELAQLFQEHQNEFGVLPGIGEMQRARFLQRMLENPELVEANRTATRAEIMESPEQYGWPRGAGAPEYSHMRYYAGQVPTPQSGYAELLERQGAPPTAYDQRQYTEPHWGGAGHGNNITMHLRLEDATTPEGNPAMLVNELQSKYAAQLGEQGTTGTPLTLRPVSELAAEDMGKIEQSLQQSALGNFSIDEMENSDLAHLLDVDDYEWFRDKLDEVYNDPDALAAQRDDILAEMQTRLSASRAADLQRRSPSSDVVLDDNATFIAGHKGQPFSRDNNRLYASDPTSQMEAANRLELFNMGGGNSFVGDPRLPPRAGSKSWRLRGLKMALREAADRGATDVYFPTGDMMPRIEGWAPEDVFDRPEDYGGWRSMDEADRNARAMTEQMADDTGDEYKQLAVMRNYDERLPKEFLPYLKKFGATLERAPMRSLNDDAQATAMRIRFTPELLAEVLRGQKLYQLGGGAALLGLLAASQEEQPAY